VGFESCLRGRSGLLYPGSTSYLEPICSHRASSDVQMLGTLCPSIPRQYERLLKLLDSTHPCRMARIGRVSSPESRLWARSSRVGIAPPMVTNPVPLPRGLPEILLDKDLKWDTKVEYRPRLRSWAYMDSSSGHMVIKMAHTHTPTHRARLFQSIVTCRFNCLAC